MHCSSHSFTSHSVSGKQQHFPFTLQVVQLHSQWMRPKQNQTTLHLWWSWLQFAYVYVIYMYQHYFGSQGAWVQKNMGLWRRAVTSLRLYGATYKAGQALPIVPNSCELLICRPFIWHDIPVLFLTTALAVYKADGCMAGRVCVTNISRD